MEFFWFNNLLIVLKWLINDLKINKKGKVIKK